MVLICEKAPEKNTMPQDKNNTTEVRIAVAKLESTFLTPTFAKIAVMAANKADNMA